MTDCGDQTIVPTDETRCPGNARSKPDGGNAFFVSGIAQRGGISMVLQIRPCMASHPTRTHLNVNDKKSVSGFWRRGCFEALRRALMLIMFLPSLLVFSSHEVDSPCLRLARGAARCHGDRPSHPPNPGPFVFHPPDPPIALQSISRDAPSSQGGDGETHCLKVRSGNVSDGPSLRSQAVTPHCGLPLA